MGNRNAGSDRDDQGALDKLFQQVEEYRNSKNFHDLLTFIKRFPKYAPFNAFLLHTQKPGSLYVASVSEWDALNRSVKPGARPLVILWPFAPVHFVYELGDTEGDEPLPDEVINPFKNRGSLSRGRLEILLGNLLCFGISCHESDHGSASAGFIEVAKVPEIRTIQDQRVRVNYHLVLNQNHENAVKFATAAHELGHLFCGHLGTMSDRLWPNRAGLAKEVEEFEAESVAWLLCERANLENPSAQYLADYLDSHAKIPEISVETVLKAVRMVESMLEKPLRPRKEVLVDSKESK